MLILKHFMKEVHISTFKYFIFLILCMTFKATRKHCTKTTKNYLDQPELHTTLNGSRNSGNLWKQLGTSDHIKSYIIK